MSIDFLPIFYPIFLDLCHFVQLYKITPISTNFSVSGGYSPFPCRRPYACVVIISICCRYCLIISILCPSEPLSPENCYARNSYPFNLRITTSPLRIHLCTGSNKISTCILFDQDLITQSYHALYRAAVFAISLEIANHSINWLLYSLRLKLFREQLMKSFCCDYFRSCFIRQ